MNNSIVFHHPFPVFEEGTSGSQVRPYQMLNAFKELGYKIELIAGYAKDRIKSIERVKRQIKNGRKFAFVYAESSTMPTLLTEKHHLPLYPFIDFNFFYYIKEYETPLGLFYRDIYWRFELYRKQVAWYKRSVAIPLYLYDIWQYSRLVDILFIPSKGMTEFIPNTRLKGKVSPLPPGCKIYQNIDKFTPKNSSNVIKLLYVGGVLPPIYDLRPMIQALKGLESTLLNLVCRSQEWGKVKKIYECSDFDRITINHASGEKLGKFYKEADIFAFFWQPHSYLNFAMPIKLFEALGYGLPIITTAGTEAARFVKEENIGWVVSSIDEFCHLISYLHRNRQQLVRIKQNLLQVQQQHTWLARAARVAEVMASSKDII